ncbi:Putative SH3 domain-containing protein [Septoria linicola]|uniref:SH3 domain-containing protein n=1 Tax=Septoria linicola TaxID=215465 RepID=A0A9Q9AGS3_9PEZI|nr:putative SH3 domain-containing protein [Septoria linicola]USW48862.1 Putative SH3 domain-containing protein [Septoria linicola]
MAEVLAAPAAQHQHTTESSPSPASFVLSTSQQEQTKRPDRSERDRRRTSQASNRMSQVQQPQPTACDRSRPHSTAFPAFASSLPYALVRDFAYPAYHPMHFGGPAEEGSSASTPAGWDSGRRLSESAESSTSGGKGWHAGPWGGDGVLYGDPEQDMEPLPSTSFGATGEDWGDDETSFKVNKHRKSRSFHDIPNYERGRRRESQGRSRGQEESSTQASQQYDPAGRDALRQSRGFTPSENGDRHPRRDSHFATTLPNRSFHTSQPIDPDSDLPLDAEPSEHHSPQRESMGPEDEELFAGPSLALYGFEPENENELRLVEGEMIMVSYRHGQGWLVAEKDNGDQGLVPEAYVRLLRDIEGWDEETGQFIEGDPFGPGTEEVTTPTGNDVRTNS